MRLVLLLLLTSCFSPVFGQHIQVGPALGVNITQDVDIPISTAGVHLSFRPKVWPIYLAFQPSYNIGTPGNMLTLPGEVGFIFGKKALRAGFGAGIYYRSNDNTGMKFTVQFERQLAPQWTLHIKQGFCGENWNDPQTKPPVKTGIKSKDDYNFVYELHVAFTYDLRWKRHAGDAASAEL